MEGYLRKKLGASSLPASGGAPWVSATYCQSPEIPALLAAGKLRRQAGLILGNAVSLPIPAMIHLARAPNRPTTGLRVFPSRLREGKGPHNFRVYFPKYFL